MFEKHVIAVRIYEGGITGTQPLADLYMNDGVVEHIDWTNARQRKEFVPLMNGYTLF